MISLLNPTYFYTPHIPRQRNKLLWISFIFSLSFFLSLPLKSKHIAGKQNMELKSNTKYIWDIILWILSALAFRKFFGFLEAIMADFVNVILVLMQLQSQWMLLYSNAIGKFIERKEGIQTFLDASIKKSRWIKFSLGIPNFRKANSIIFN